VPGKDLKMRLLNCESDFLQIAAKVKGQDTCYTVAYLRQIQEQQHFTISEVAADWHELMTPQHIMRLSVLRTNRTLDPRCS